MSDDQAGEWLTWVEAAQVLGIKPESVQRRARSRRWPRRTGNDGLARVQVPRTALPDVREDRRKDVPPDNRPDESGLLIRAIEAEARAKAAEMMLENMQGERDRWREMAERLSHREVARPTGLIARFFGRGRLG